MGARTGSRALLFLAGLLALVVIAVLLVTGPLNPFGTDTEDRSQPVLIKSLENLSDYHAATANMQVVVDVEEDARLLPSFIKGERTLFVAVGNVDAQVDFSRLGKDAVKVSEDGKAVTVTLPSPTLGKPYLDVSRSRVVSRERGVLDRIGSALGDNPDDNRELYQVAEQKLAAAAQETDLAGRAETNTRTMLTGLIRSLGYEKVTVNFVDQPVER